MKQNSLRRAAAPLLVLALACSLALPASAFFWNKKTQAPYVADFSKNGLIGSAIAFTTEDFVVRPDGKTALSGITVDTLPDPGAGTLCVGDRPRRRRAETRLSQKHIRPSRRLHTSRSRW